MTLDALRLFFFVVFFFLQILFLLGVSLTYFFCNIHVFGIKSLHLKIWFCQIAPDMSQLFNNDIVSECTNTVTCIHQFNSSCPSLMTLK